MESLPNGEVLPDVDDKDLDDSSSEDGEGFVNSKNVGTNDADLIGDMDLTEEDKKMRRKSTNMLTS